MCCCCSAEHGWGCGMSMQTTNQSWSFIAINSGIILDFQAPASLNENKTIFIYYLFKAHINLIRIDIYHCVFIQMINFNPWLKPYPSYQQNIWNAQTVNPGLVSVTDFIITERSHLDVVYIVVISWHYSWQWGRSLKL